MVHTLEEIQETIQRKATIYMLDPLLIEAMCWVESEMNTFAMRREAGFWNRYIRPISNTIYDDLRWIMGYVTHDTESQLRSYSFGLMQVMGQTARELKFNGLLGELLDPEIGIDYGCKYYRKQLLRYDFDMYKALSAYNAGTAKKVPSQHDYVKKVLSKYKEIMAERREVV